MRVGIIDLGTNSIRFDIHSIQQGKTTLLYREKLMVRLGEGVFVSRRLEPDAIRRALTALKGFSETARRFQIDRMVAFGTSALREAKNQTQFIQQVRRETKIPLEVLSGEDEARLIALGLLKKDKKIASLKATPVVGLVDIGGGSTEISLLRNHQALHAVSFPLGVARLQQTFLVTSPPTPESVIALRKHIRALLHLRRLSDDWPKVQELVGSSGTVLAIAKMVNNGPSPGRRSIERKDLKRLVRTLQPMNQAALLQVPRIEAKRVDLILAGTIVLEEIMACLGAKKIRPTELSLRDGILQSVLEDSSVLPRIDPIAEIVPHVKKIAPDSFAHLQQVAKLLEQLILPLRNLHGLSPEWLRALRLAAWTHDMGQLISPIQHGVHSAYWVSNLPLKSLTETDRARTSWLNLYHSSGKIDKKALSELPPRDRIQGVRALALLRIADALDRSHKQLIPKITVKVSRGKVQIVLPRGDRFALERLRLEQKRELFEGVFGRKLEL